MSATVLNKKGVSRIKFQVERFTNEYSDWHLKGILEEEAINMAPVVYDTGC